MRTAYDIARWLRFMSVVEVAVLEEYALKLPERPIIVNIGAGGGTSGLLFLQCRPDSRVVTVDINPTGYGSLEAERNAIKDAGLLGELNGRFHQILGDSSDIGRRWEGGPIDLVFVDADHSEEGCRKDILAWAPHVKAGGFMLLHDYDNLPLWPGVKPATDSTLRKFYEWSFQELIRTTIVFQKVERVPVGHGT